MKRNVHFPRSPLYNRLSRTSGILDDRKTIIAEYDEAQRADEDTSAIEARIDRFNEENPDSPVTPKTIIQYMRSRAKMRERKVGGVGLNPRLADRLHEETPALVRADEEEELA